MYVCFFRREYHTTILLSNGIQEGQSPIVKSEATILSSAANHKDDKMSQQQHQHQDSTTYHPLRTEPNFRPGLRNHEARVAAAYSRTARELIMRQVTRLPCSAVDFYDDESLLPAVGWNPILKTLLAGTRSHAYSEESVESVDVDNHAGDKDDSASLLSPLVLLRNYETTVLRHIWSFVPHPYAQHVRLTLPADLFGSSYDGWKMIYVQGRSRTGGFQRRLIDDGAWQPPTTTAQGFAAFARVANQIEFPPAKQRNVNMMPFILGQKESLPTDLQCYYDMIDACPWFREENGKVAYLTVQESQVAADETQRRPGLHIESPGVLADDNNASAFFPGVEHSWGMGIFYGPDRYEGGIYLASNVDNSTQVWDALVDRTVPGIVDRYGGCEHLRRLLPDNIATTLGAGDLIWMTDCTPHEALPALASGTRQFFRLVMPNVSHWYADHSTPNPKVPLPKHVTVIRGNKFKPP